jgi:RNA polymerase sigma-70 factor (ECF subfamily)
MLVGRITPVPHRREAQSLLETLMIKASRPLEARPEGPSRRPVEAPWAGVVRRIRAGDPSGMAELYDAFTTGIRFYLCRQLGPQDLDDRVHEAFLTITQSIRRGDLREPQRLMGYVHTVLRRQVAAQIESVVDARRNRTDPRAQPPLADHHPDPELTLIEHESNEVALRVLQSLPQRDREVLTRFYLDEQTPGDICREMRLTGTQFRLIKSRAKRRFGELGRARMAHRGGSQALAQPS